MESGSQGESPLKATPQDFENLTLANFVGAVIALLTLFVPLFAIAHFSSLTEQNWQPPAQLLPHK